MFLAPRRALVCWPLACLPLGTIEFRLETDINLTPLIGGKMDTKNRHEKLGLTIKSGAKRFFLGVAAIATLGMGVVGCDSDDARIIGGTIAVVAGVHAIDSAFDRRCHGGYRTVCRSTRDRWGRIHRDCDQVWDSCARRYSNDFTLSADSSLALDQSATLAAKYELPLEAAGRLSDLLGKVAIGEASAFEALGLSNDELGRMAKYKMPTDGALDQIGSALAISREMARGLVEKLMAETKQQMADVNSPAWAACIAPGKWKTDANGGTCKSTAWTGCSPETGASVCAALK
jgi:hypothetical protein